MSEQKKTEAAPGAELPRGRNGRVFLIDSMSFIFRAYHAMARQRPMSTRQGLPTGAVFVFVNMLNKLRRDFAPERIAAVFDLPGKTVRAEQAEAMPPLKKKDKATGEIVSVPYAGYKANREAMPEELAAQIPYIRRVIEAFRIPILAVPGWEADDVIGTLSAKAEAAGYGVAIVSGDKDMMQLVGGDVSILNPTKDNLVCDADKVRELMGVTPSQIVDLLALRGDAIDNVPGAPGIGDKGSVELLQQFATLDALLERAAEVARKSYRESLLDNREIILLSRQLVTINRSVDIDFDPEAMRAMPPDAAALEALFGELEFTSMLSDIAPEATRIDGAEYRAAASADDLEELLAARADAPLAVALSAAAAPKKKERQQSLLEAPTPDDEAALGMTLALSVRAGQALTLPLDGSPLSQRALQLLADASIPKAAHDAKALAAQLDAIGGELRNVTHETMLAAYLLDPTNAVYSLEAMAQRHLNLRLSGAPEEAADATLRLALQLAPELQAKGFAKLYAEMELPLVGVLRRMERAGVRIDQGELASLSHRLGAQIESLSARIQELAGEEFNLNSPKQLGEILFEKLALPRPWKAGKGKTASTAQDVLEELAGEHEIARLMLEFRQLSKLKSTYIDALPKLADADDRIHTCFQQAATATGRLSSVNPNLQNIPVRTELGREIRAAFVAPEGRLLMAADYSQIELRLLAHCSGDELLVEAYNTGRDIHALTAAEVFGVPPMLIDAEHRRRAKAVNFGIVYGLSPFGLAQQLGIPQKEAKRFIEAYFERYAGVRSYLDDTLEQARANGCSTTLFGRVRPIPDLNARNAAQRGFAERTALNTPLQGSAADLIKLAMIAIDRELTARGMQSRMLLQVHDELLFELPTEEEEALRELVSDKMTHAAQLRVPLEVNIGVGRNWRDAK